MSWGHGTGSHPFGNRVHALQAGRQRREILLLQRAGISSTSAEALLQRMLDKIDGLCTARDRLKAELPRPKGRVLGGRKW